MNRFEISKLDLSIQMSDVQITCLSKYLSNAKKYFEFGIGGSTALACMHENIQKIISIESDQAWVKKLSEVPFIAGQLKTGRCVIQATDFNVKPNLWGYPVDDALPEDKVKYPRAILQHADTDLVLIDGRFRVACALHTFMAVSDSAYILVDDYQDREHYTEIENWFDVIERVDKMVVLKKKKTPNPSAQIFDRFEKDPR